MRKILLWIVIIIVLLVGGFYVLNSYIYNEKQTEEEQVPLASYFEERMNTLGVEDIGQPIEGFDANLLMMAFPGLIARDFSGVETFGGHYEVQGGEAIFIQDGSQPRTSAERTVSREGYATLLENISARLSFPTENESDIDELIKKIDTGQRIRTRIDQGASALGVKIIPLEVIEDSRCPVNADCIQAGTVRIRASLQSGLGTADQMFELNTPITTETEEVTLVQVDPAPQAGMQIDTSEYIFHFEVKDRRDIII